MRRLVMERRSKRRQLCPVVILLNGSRPVPLPVNQQSQVQQPPQQTAQEQGQQQAQGQQPQAQAQQQPTTALLHPCRRFLHHSSRLLMLIRRHWKSYLHLFCSRSSLLPRSGAVCPQRNGRYERGGQNLTINADPTNFKPDGITVSWCIHSAGTGISKPATTVTFSDATGHPRVLGAPPYNSSPCASGGELCVGYIRDRRYSQSSRPMPMPAGTSQCF